MSIVVHEVGISIPPSINLIIACTCNDKKIETQKRRKIDPLTKTVAFEDQPLKMPLLECGPSAVIGIKLQAVSDSKSKLIGLYQLKVPLRRDENRDLDHKRVEFDKCIDKQAYMIVSTRMGYLQMGSTQSNVDLKNLVKF